MHDWLPREDFQRIFLSFKRIIVENTRDLGVEPVTLGVELVDGDIRLIVSFSLKAEALVTDEELQTQRTNEEFEALMLGQEWEDPEAQSAVEQKLAEQAETTMKDINDFFD